MGVKTNQALLFREKNHTEFTDTTNKSVCLKPTFIIPTFSVRKPYFI